MKTQCVNSVHTILKHWTETAGRLLRDFFYSQLHCNSPMSKSEADRLNEFFSLFGNDTDRKSPDKNRMSLSRIHGLAVSGGIQRSPLPSYFHSWYFLQALEEPRSVAFAGVFSWEFYHMMIRRSKIGFESSLYIEITTTNSAKPFSLTHISKTTWAIYSSITLWRRSIVSDQPFPLIPKGAG